VATATVVDWAAQGAVGPVKDQQICGSCYAFAANTVLEGTIAAKTGKPYRHLSEQQVVDCSNDYGNKGCQGGWMANVWDYAKDFGLTTESEYPYEASNKTCREDPDKVVEQVATRGRIQNANVELALHKLQS
jgi:cathepsin L